MAGGEGGELETFADVTADFCFFLADGFDGLVFWFGSDDGFNFLSFVLLAANLTVRQTAAAAKSQPKAVNMSVAHAAPTRLVRRVVRRTETKSGRQLA